MSHGALLRQASDDPELASGIMHDHTTLDLDPRLRGMLDFAVKLTKSPSEVERADIDGLRDLGLSDEEVLSTVLVTCLFNFMTRLADGLGVELSAGLQRHIESWLSGAATQQTWMLTPKD